MKKLAGIVATVALLMTACGDRGEDSSGGVNGGGTTNTSASGQAAAGDWGDLKGVCGPKEGGGEVPATDAQGVSADTIKLGTVADPGFSGQPGLNQELFDAGDAFVAWCNAAGGINGKKLELTKHDAALTNYQPVIEDACKTDFALVGGGAVQDNLWPSVGAACGLIDVAGFAVTPEKAGKAGDLPSETRTVQPVPNPSDRYPVGPALMLEKEYPDAGQRQGFVWADFQTLIQQKEKEEKAFDTIGFTTVHEGVYNIGGEDNWKPFATAIKDDKVSLLSFIGQANNAGNLELAMKQVGYVPDVRLYETNFYDPNFIEVAGDAADGAYIGSAFVPMEEADTHPATQLYLDNVKKIDGKPALLGLQSTSAWLLFASLAKACDKDNDLTRTCILKAAEKVTQWTGGGLHGLTSPASNEGSNCWMVMVVKDQKFTRWGPTDEDFSCDNSYQARLDG